MDISNLSSILVKEPKFRFKQANQALFQDFVSSWDEVSVFPLSLREKLSTACPLEIKAELSQSKKSKEGPVKALISLNDGQKIESVLIYQPDGRQVVCLSCQVGCPLACSFCSTGKLGFKRNLSAEEMIIQFLFWARYLKTKGKKIDNLVFMGMGEPFLNYDQFIKAVKAFNNPETFNFGARRMSVSTVGIPAGIKRLAKEPYQINLAISLHAPNDNLRRRLMPAAKQYPLQSIFQVADYYLGQTKRRLMWEYLILSGVNDSEQDAKELAKLMKKPLYFLNLIPFNEGAEFKAPDSNRLNKFKDILTKAGVAVTLRHSQGQDISAACGQLALKKKDCE